MKSGILIAIFIISVFTAIIPVANSKTSAISKAPVKDIYYKCPKIQFADKQFVMKHSYYNKSNYDYTNEYYRLKENKTSWTEKIVIDNYIKIHSPVDYAYEITTQHKDGMVLYQLKYRMAVVSFSQKVKSSGKLCNQIVLQKINLNPHSPGVQVASYIFKQNDTGSNKQAEEFKKLIIDKSVIHLLEFNMPILYRYDLNVK